MNQELKKREELVDSQAERVRDERHEMEQENKKDNPQPPPEPEEQNQGIF